LAIREIVAQDLNKIVEKCSYADFVKFLLSIFYAQDLNKILEKCSYADFDKFLVVTFGMLVVINI
jgi:hypothetical protein